MVEPITLGLIVAALVAKTLDRAGDKALDEGEGVLRKLVDTLRKRFSGADGQPGAMALKSLEDAPDSQKRVRKLAELLDEALGKPADEASGFRLELEGLVAEARAAGVDVDSVSQVALGDQNVQAVNSKVNVTFGSWPGDDSPGARSSR